MGRPNRSSFGSTYAGRILVSLSITGIAQPIYAQEAATPGAASSEVDGGATEIVVTAQKRAQKLSDVPMSITALSGDTLAQHGVNDIQDLVKLTPGLSYIDSGASIPVFSLRGVGFFDTALAARPTVSVYIDEVPQPFSAMTLGSSFDLERVEVLKGPQGTLFGQNATGGAINYIATKPTPDFAAGFTASYARFNTASLEGYVSGPVSDTLAVRLAAKLQRGGDWQYSATREDSLGQQDFLQGRFIADWKPVDGVKLSLALNGFRDRSDTQASQFLAAVPASAARAPTYIPLLLSYTPPPHSDRVADWDADTPLQRNNGYYQAALRGDIALGGSVALTSITSYQHYKLDQTTDQDGTAFENTLTMQDGGVSSFAQEIRLAGKLTHVNWIIGASYAHDMTAENNILFINYNSTRYTTLPFGTVPALRQIADNRFNTYAAFGNVDYYLADTVVLHAGARYTKAGLSYNACTADYEGQTVAGFTGVYNALRAARGLSLIPTIAPNSCISVDASVTPAKAIGRQKEDNIAWRAGLDWKPSDRTLLYANVSRGYKAGSPPNVSALSSVQFIPVVQESVLAYEIGARLPLLDRAVDVSGALFYYDYRNKQLKSRILTTPNLFGAVEALVNIPKSRVWGGEFQVNVRPLNGLTMTLAGTYLSSRIDGAFHGYTIFGTSEDFGGSSFSYTPKYQGVADATYYFGLSDRLRAFIGGNANYRSKTSAGFGQSALLKIDSYVLVDARIGFETVNRKWRLTLFGQNLGNEYYWTNVAKIGDIARRITGRPLTYGARVSMRID